MENWIEFKLPNVNINCLYIIDVVINGNFIYDYIDDISLINVRNYPFYFSVVTPDLCCRIFYLNLDFDLFQTSVSKTFHDMVYYIKEKIRKDKLKLIEQLLCNG